MPIKDLIPKIELGPDAEDRLKRVLDERIEAGVRFRTESHWNDLHEMYWRMHLTVPEQKTKTWPWPNASNMFLPLTQVMDHAIVAHEFDTLLTTDPTVIGFESSDYDNAQDLTSYYFDYFFKEVVPLQSLGADWLLDNVVDGTSVIKIRQNRDFVVRREENVEPVTKEVSLSEFGMPAGETASQIVDYHRVERAYIDRIEQTTVDLSDLERIYVAPDSGPGLQWPTCPWYYQTQDLTWDDLIERRRQGYKISDEIKSFLGKREPTDKETLIKEQEGTSDTEVPDTVRVIEMFMRWPLPARYQMIAEEKPEGENKDEIKQGQDEKDGYHEEIIVTYCPDTREIMLLRPLSRVCPDGKRPHIVNHYHRINGRYFYGTGVPSKLRYLQSAVNTNWNQGNDYGTLSNLPFFLYSPSMTGVLPSLTGISPGQGIEVQDPRGVLFPRFNTDPNYFLAKNQQIEQYAEKVAMISETSQGRNPTTPNAPRTARGMYYQIQQSSIAFSMLVSLHAQPFIEMFRKVHAFHKRWAKPETIFRIMNKQTGMFQNQSIKGQRFDQDVDFRFTFNNSRYAEAQTNTALYQITLDAISKAMVMPNFAPNIRSMLSDIWLSSGKKNFDLVWPKNLIPAPPAAMTQPTLGGALPQKTNGGFNQANPGALGGEMPKPEVAI